MTIPASSSTRDSYYRPKRAPRVLRQQMPAVVICSSIVLGGLLIWAVTWRNLYHERITLDAGMQRAQIATLNKEIQHLQGQIENETSYPRVAKWARDNHGWLALPNHTATVSVPESTLLPVARVQARLLRNTSHE